MGRGNSGNKSIRKYIKIDDNGYYLYSYFENEEPEEFMVQNEEGLWLDPNQNVSLRKWHVYPARRFSEHDLKAPYFNGRQYSFDAIRNKVYLNDKECEMDVALNHLLNMSVSGNYEGHEMFIYLGD